MLKRIKISTVYGSIAVILHLWNRYDDWWWYDNLAHLSTGIALGALTSEDKREALLLTFGLAVLWEIGEYKHGVYPWNGDLPTRAAVEDTVLDTLLVLIGAYVANEC